MRNTERERVKKRERKREIEKEGRERERDVEYGCFILILKGMTGALAPFSYLVLNIDLHTSIKLLGSNMSLDIFLLFSNCFHYNVNTFALCKEPLRKGEGLIQLTSSLRYLAL